MRISIGWSLKPIHFPLEKSLSSPFFASIKIEALNFLYGSCSDRFSKLIESIFAPGLKNVRSTISLLAQPTLKAFTFKVKELSKT